MSAENRLACSQVATAVAVVTIVVAAAKGSLWVVTLFAVLAVLNAYFVGRTVSEIES